MNRARNRPIATLVVAMATLLAAGCGSGDDEVSETTQPEVTEPDTTAATTTPPEVTEPSESDMTEPPETTTPVADDPAPDIVTEEDDGAAFVMHTGDEVALRLSSDWAWEAPSLEGITIELVPVDYLVDPGYVEWLLLGVASGAAQITVSGSPNCGDEAACPPRTVTLHLQVDA